MSGPFWIWYWSRRAQVWAKLPREFAGARAALAERDELRAVCAYCLVVRQ